MRFDLTITLGNVLTVIAALAAAFAAWKDVSYRIASLEQWRKEHTAATEVALAGLEAVKEAVMLLKGIASGQERRIIMLEEERHGRD